MLHRICFNLIFLLNIFAASEILNDFHDDINCTDLFEGIERPLKCCTHPMLYMTNTSAQHCIEDCKDDDDKSCCYFKCTIIAYKIYEDGKFNGENLLKVYEESMEGNKQSDKDLWMPAMKKFNEQCEKIVPDFNATRCHLPLSVAIRFECLTHQNFIQCVNFHDTDECNATVQFMKSKATKCGVSFNGTFIPYHYYYYYY